MRFADLRAYRIIEALLRANGAKSVPSPGALFPSLRDLEMEPEVDEPRAAFEAAQRFSIQRR